MGHGDLIAKFTALFWLSCFYGDVVAQMQQSTPIEVSKCTDYKKTLFEEVKTFSAFMHGAEPFHITVDRCKQFAPFIVGGSPAGPKEFPLIARLGISKRGIPIRWICGGTLISSKYVLTAAHCFYDSDEDEVNIVRLGELDFSSDSEDARPQDFSVVRNIPHPDYNEDFIYNDVGLVELDGIVKFDQYKHPACLPTTRGDEFDKFLAVGWGSIRYADVESKQLLKVTLDRFSYNRCRTITDKNEINQLPRGLDDNSQLCAGSNDIKDTCSGDSGGPLLAYHKDYPCMYNLVGIVSYGIGCGNPDVPGIYTRVYNYMTWVKSIVWP